MNVSSQLQFAFICALVTLLASSAFAINPQTWMKKMGQQKTRKSSQRQTMVAAVRGMDDPNQVDPNARDFEALEKMEKRTIAAGKLAQFLEEGKLKKGEKP